MTVSMVAKNRDAGELNVTNETWFRLLAMPVLAGISGNKEHTKSLVHATAQQARDCAAALEKDYVPGDLEDPWLIKTFIDFLYE